MNISAIERKTVIQQIQIRKGSTRMGGKQGEAEADVELDEEGASSVGL